MPNHELQKRASSSSRAKRGICFFLALVFLVPLSAQAQNPPRRPRILGIAEVSFFSTELGAARNFYGQVLGVKEISPNAFSLNSEQSLALFVAPSPVSPNLLAEVVFATDNLGELLKYLTAQKIEFTPKLVSGIQHWDVIRPGYSALSLIDPEGNRIRFVQESKPRVSPNHAQATRPTSAPHIIHAGFIVHDRAAMEHFYKDILGFRPYWHGGMKDDETNWVSLQVPDGSDWIEFMLNVPENADQRLRGIMNHIALGVTDIHAAQEQLRKNGVPLTEEPKIGRDGKWQLNLYDPDQTRIEFMEFTPVQKPCCSEFTAPHPKP